MRFIICLMALFNASTVYSQSSGSKQIAGQMIVDGMQRKIITYIPAGAPNSKMPLIISLHGGFASPKGQFHLADFRPIADKEKFMVICPASKRMWHDGEDIHGIDDVKFIDQVISYAIETYNADPDRVYVTGISNGGFMTARLACQLNNRIAAVAIVAATLDIGEGYDLERPMPVLYMHGTSDPIVSFKGGGLFGRKIYSHDDIVKKWVAFNKCDADPYVTTIPDSAGDETSIIKEEYINKINGLKVLSYTIINGGHTWPGGWQYVPKFIIGKTTRNLNACQEIWQFFKPYKLSHKSQF